MEPILIIDDDPAIVNVFTQFLENLGYSVQSASEGKEALGLINKQPPALIITDILMPEMDGLEIVTYIREHHPDLPVIAVSGGMKTASMNFLPLAQRFGACKVFEKPVPLSKLRAAVEELLGPARSE